MLKDGGEKVEMEGWGRVEKQKWTTKSGLLENWSVKVGGGKPTMKDRKRKWRMKDGGGPDWS